VSAAQRHDVGGDRLAVEDAQDVSDVHVATWHVNKCTLAPSAGEGGGHIEGLVAEGVVFGPVGAVAGEVFGGFFYGGNGENEHKAGDGG
jgi:hypothetical protein